MAEQPPRKLTPVPSMPVEAFATSRRRRVVPKDPATLDDVLAVLSDISREITSTRKLLEQHMKENRQDFAKARRERQAMMDLLSEVLCRPTVPFSDSSPSNSNESTSDSTKKET